MSAFATQLSERNPPAGGDRRWVFVPYDQLGDRVGPLAETEPGELGVVVVESAWKADRRPYHKQKLALVLANLRHFALEQADRGVRVEHVASDRPYSGALAPVIERLGRLEMMEAAERELRADLAPLIDRGAIEVLPHGGWLTTGEDFAAASDKRGRWRMDRFYRRVRKRTGVLMDERGKPIGGKLSFDTANRERWSGEPAAPVPPTFEVDAITTEVTELIERLFADHPGALCPERLPATAGDAARLWAWAREACMPWFGPFEDAMSTASRGLFHTRISPLLNLGRLLPAEVIADVCALHEDGAVDIASAEGFVRQVLGWREFVRHVHRATDGFRAAGGRDDFLGASVPLPPAFWGSPSGLGCLDRVVADVWDEAYSHHITRLMILSNIASLLDVDARELSDWFWVAYADAYDWVVEPNVIGMGTFAAGDLMTTKPYISGAAYIDKMSDYCRGCQFDPAETCPITPMYWAYLARHRASLEPLPRMKLPLASLSRRSEAKRAADRRTFERVSRSLAAGERLDGGER